MQQRHVSTGVTIEAQNPEVELKIMLCYEMSR